MPVEEGGVHWFSYRSNGVPESLRFHTTHGDRIMNTSRPRQLVINWHLTEACNYRCQYCYAAWQDSACSSEVVKETGRAMALLEELYRFFRSDNHANRLAEWFSGAVRLNLAGGEPLLHDARLPIIVDEARRLGFEVSMITNGKRPKKDWQCLRTPACLHNCLSGWF